jgi:DNA-binding Lrp family transcriptional regulator
MKALEAHGVIQRYVALANPKALGLGLNVFINISLKEQAEELLAEFERPIPDGSISASFRSGQPIRMATSST